MNPEDIKTQSIFRQVLVNTISNYGGKIVTLGVWFFLTPYILHNLGQDVYGMWVIVGSLISYGSLLDFGIANAITKYVAEFYAREEFSQARSLVATALWLYTLLALVAVILGAILAPLLPIVFNIPPADHHTFSWMVFLSGIGLGVSLISTAPIAVLRGLHRFDIINMVGITGMLLLAGSTVLVLKLGGGPVSLVAVNILVNIFMQVPTVWLIHRYAGKLHFGFRGAEKSKIRTVAGFSSALFVINIAGQLRAKTDEIVVGSFLSVSSVTPYSIAHRLSEIPQILTEQFMKVLMPLASRLNSEKDYGRLRQLYLTSTRLTLAIFLPLGLGAVILARQFLSAWVGTAYSQYDWLVLLLVIASLFDTLMWPPNFILQGMARHRLLAIAAIVSGLVNLGISIALVRPLGLAGVALGTLIPTTLECVFFVIPYSMRLIQVDWRTAIKEIYLPVILPSLMMTAILFGLRYLVNPSGILSILLVGVAGLLVYLVTFYIVGARALEKQLFIDLLRNTWKSVRIQS